MTREGEYDAADWIREHFIWATMTGDWAIPMSDALARRLAEPDEQIKRLTAEIEVWEAEVRHLRALLTETADEVERLANRTELDPDYRYWRLQLDDVNALRSAAARARKIGGDTDE